LTLCQRFVTYYKIFLDSNCQGEIMKTSKSVLKRERQNTEARARNKVIKTKVHTSLIRVVKSLDSNENQTAQDNLKKYVSDIDKAIKKGVIHKNKGARLKSRISKRINKKLKEAPKAEVKPVEKVAEKPVENKEEKTNS
jgi:small subunit ribosomal protein S20